MTEVMNMLLVMCVGILIGNRLFPEKYKKVNEKLQTVCTVLLIFCMGVILGSRENFLEELGTLGGTSFLFFLIPSGFSLILVYPLTRKFLAEKNREEKHGKSEQSDYLKTGQTE